jgi:DNA-binding winged helix-turn-helix (wHTH) protein
MPILAMRLLRGTPPAPMGPMSKVSQAQQSFAFGPFLLEPQRQLLLRGETRVRIGGRAFDLLTALVERPGEVLSKGELLSRGWPDIFVDETNLKVNMSSLRKILGDQPEDPRFIATIAGRGYRFVAPVRVSNPA